MARFERVHPAPSEWKSMLDSFPDRIVFQSPAWVSFLAETQNAEPVLAALKEGGSVVGLFTGLIVRKLGLRILGSPFRGWSTPYMGFNLAQGIPRRLAVEALADFAFKELRCIHVEVTDAKTSLADVDGLGFSHFMHNTLEVDLTQSEEQIFAHMTKSCRWTIRKGEKNGVVIEEASDLGFADDYAAQLKEVFGKQGLLPHYGSERVRALIRHLQPTGMLLLLRARDHEGRCIATGLFPAFNEAAFYDAGASWRKYQRLYPNELLHWYAMRYWKKRGMRVYNMVGTMDFKRKFGGAETGVPMIYRSRYRLLTRLRTSARPIVFAMLGLAWKIKNLGRGKVGNTETNSESNERVQESDPNIPLLRSHNRWSCSDDSCATPAYPKGFQGFD